MSSLPDTPVGRQLAWVTERIAGGGDVALDEVAEHVFLPGFASPHVQVAFRRMAARGPMTLVRIDSSSSYGLGGIVRFGPDRVRISVQVEREDPHRLISLRFRPLVRFVDLLGRTPAAASPEEAFAVHLAAVAGSLAAGGLVAGAVCNGKESLFKLGPVTTEALFEIGSVTKPFTATLLAEMAGRGEVQLDQPLASLLPDDVSVPVDGGGREITLVDLATHSAGLPRIAPDWSPADRKNPYADFTVEKLYSALSRTVLDGEIGETVSYTNYGYSLLGHALARAAGCSFHDLLRERVLAPLGLSETAVRPAGELRLRRVQGHDAAGSPMPHWDRPVQDAAGGLESTARDLLRWLGAQLRPDSTPLAGPITATQRPVLTTPTGAGIGLGWYLLSLPRGGCVVWHNGRTGGFTSSVLFHPESRIGLVVLTNSTAARLDQAARATLAALINSADQLGGGVN